MSSTFHEHEVFSQKWTDRCEEIIHEVRKKHYTTKQSGKWRKVILSDETVGFECSWKGRDAISFKLGFAKLLMLKSGRGKYRYEGYEVKFGDSIRRTVLLHGIKIGTVF